MKTLPMILLILSSAVVAYGVSQTVGIGGPPVRRDGQAIDGSLTPRRGEIRAGNASARPADLPRNVRELKPGVFEINDTRPLEVASKVLSQKLGVSISYEEASWASSRDVMPAAEHPANAAMVGKTQGPLIPRGGMLTVTVPPKNSATAESVIQTALDNHRNNRNPGEFKLVRIQDRTFSIVADFAEDEKGTVVKQFNPLDQLISFPESERTVDETLNLIYGSITSASGKRHTVIVPLSMSPLLFTVVRIRLGASNETAREVLARALGHPAIAVQAWSLRFDPQLKIYGISYRMVEEEVVGPTKGVVLRPLAF